MDRKIKKYKIQKQGKYYYRGNWDDNLFTKSIAVVGSRQMTKYGVTVIDKFVSDFCLNNVTTISGFMYGVDTEVAKKTIEYGGKHIAVLGCGLDYIYPPENENLYLKILQTGGFIVSEYEPDAKPHLWKFPQRNKIVVDFATIGILVIEAGMNSGSLVTANLAKKASKSVWAVPGPINSTVSAGCNELIKSGEAEMATSASDILGTKTPKIKNSTAKPVTLTQGNLKLEKLELKIFKLLQLEPLEIDEIAQKLAISVVEIGSILSIMGIKGLVTESGGKYYIN